MSASIPSVVQLQRAIKIAEKIQQLEAELASILGESHAVTKTASVAAAAPRGAGAKTRKRRPYTFSAATLAKRAAAQAKRDAGASSAPKPKKKFKMSPEGRARIVAAQKARWAKQRAKG